MSDVKRPILITLIGGLGALVSILIIAVSALMMLGFAADIPLEDFGDLGDLVGVFGIGGLILGLIYFAINYGLLKGSKIMWYLGMIINVLIILLGLAGFVFGLGFGSIPMLIFSLICVFYLTRQKVKTFFGI